MDTKLFLEMLSLDSTSGRERQMVQSLSLLLKTPANTVESFEVGDGTLNLLLKWGEPKFWFCTHMDTVPPYIPPTSARIKKGDRLPDGRVAMADDFAFMGRGTCDAKGQIFSMFEACKALEAAGERGFALLLLAGEETGSFGAKAWTRDCQGGDFVVVGEPTDNCMVSASKGTKSFDITLHGIACHSGYPEQGESAVDKFLSLMRTIHETDFPEDTVLGKTTWNVGKLVSDNPKNILSPELKFSLYFRTTFASDAFVGRLLDSLASDSVEIKVLGGDTPNTYFTLDGVPSKTVAFGSDAPQLAKFSRKALFGPGSILCAHTDREYVLLSDMEKAVETYLSIFHAF